MSVKFLAKSTLEGPIKVDSLIQIETEQLKVPGRKLSLLVKSFKKRHEGE